MTSCLPVMTSMWPLTQCLRHEPIVGYSEIAVNTLIHWKSEIEVRQIRQIGNEAAANLHVQRDEAEFRDVYPPKAAMHIAYPPFLFTQNL